MVDVPWTVSGVVTAPKYQLELICNTDLVFETVHKALKLIGPLADKIYPLKVLSKLPK